MSETVKLIIEIPKPMYENVQNGTYCGTLYKELKNGMPLDSNSELAEVEAYFAGQIYGWEQGRKSLIEAVKAEINDEREFARDDFRDYKIEVLGVDSETVDDELPHDDFHRGMERVLEIIDKHIGGKDNAEMQ